jgi:uncharacterized protein YjgD (DUF1641 family)
VGILESVTQRRRTAHRSPDEHGWQEEAVIMDEKKIQSQLDDIHQKLDFITQELQQNKRRNQEFSELKDDLTIIGKDMFNSAVEELQDVAPYFDTKDLMHLMKKLLRNTKNLTRLLSQLESAEDLFKDLQPLGKHIFDEVLETLNELDQKGYFEFFKESVQIVDTIVTSFSVEDVKLLRENIASILLTVKGMTQPEMLQTIDNALGFFRKMDIEVEKDVSYFRIMKEMRNPEVKQGIVFMLEFLKNMAKPMDNKSLTDQSN